MIRRAQSSCCDLNSCCPPGCCVEVESIRARPLLDAPKARRLERLFKVMANQTRLRLLHVLIRYGELSVNDLASRMSMTPQAVSNQLQKLFAQQIVETRREGNLIFYRVVDPCVTILLDHGLCLLDSKRKKSATKRLSI
jgi:DNA-binding transcriptional ArsR family regulator